MKEQYRLWSPPVSDTNSSIEGVKKIIITQDMGDELQNATNNNNSKMIKIDIAKNQHISLFSQNTQET